MLAQKQSEGSFASLEKLMKQYMANNDATISAKRDGKEQYKALTLRNGKALPPVHQNASASIKEPTQVYQGETQSEQDIDPIISRAPEIGSTQNRVPEKRKQAEHENALAEYRSTPPYPKRLQKKKQNVQFKKFLDALKQLHVIIPLVEALEQMPNYVRFLKEILPKKRTLGEYETVAMTKACSTILTSKIPAKMKDPGSFTIPISI
ncbi:uncharacterized protein LOC111022229 [Momordica charantia]|uniref:Uncharacterized protein LOC111022229 n=1 Tax=Momordica charantia TaxID=3673 RepID=A0A6J1DNF6_MOMCH|nr:uncharacterized protein LOC111022229 [Momordica charantia]